MINLDNKRVLVSGSSQGLGHKIVETFSKNNAVGFGFDLKENVNDFADNARMLMNDIPLCNKMGENGYVYAKEKFDRNILSNQYLDFIDNKITYK